MTAHRTILVRAIKVRPKPYLGGGSSIWRKGSGTRPGSRRSVPTVGVGGRAPSPGIARPGSLIVPKSITLPPPPLSPDLNSAENEWQFLRDNWLSNRVIKSCDNIVAQCCEAWSELMAQPSRITSAGLCEWMHGF